MSETPRPPELVPVDYDPFAAPDAATLALTEPQREMWAATLMGDEANASYNQCFVLKLEGPLSHASLEKALAAVVQRHDALRIRIDAENEQQHVLPAIEVKLPLVELDVAAPADRDAAISRFIDRQTRLPFDLSVAPLWRAALIREAVDRHLFVFTAHHLVLDGWSSAVVFGDLAKSYVADRFGMPAALPEAASYRDFVADQQSPAIAAEMETANEFWAAQFASGVPAFELPLDRARPALKTYAAGREVFAIEPALYQALRKIAAQHGATLFVALLAAFEVLVARLAGVDDLVIGVPMASQALQENGHLVAHGVNTVPLRCHVDARHTFAEHLRQARKTFFDAQAHPRLTFGTLVQKLRLPRDPSRTPLVSVIFNIDKLGSPFDFGEVKVTGIDAPKSFYNFELGINAIDDGQSLLLECDYNTDLFDATSVRRWLSHYRELIAGIVADPQTPIAELPLLLPGEMQQILVDWNATRLVIDDDMRLHRLFEAQVARSPHAEALVTATDRRSYGELNAQANQIAHQLRSLGVGPEILVGVCLRRSVDLIAALLGVLKSGGAYVPLDPNYPADRIAFMLNDSQAQVLITTSDLADAVPTGRARVLLLDRNAELADRPDSNPENGAQADNLAYIIYTSGSTGVPKGVAIEHFSAATLVHWAGTVFPRTALRGVLASTSVCFDLSVFEIFFPLSHGGRVILAENALQLIEHPARDEVTLLNTVPSAVAELLREGGLPDSLSIICLAGEPLSTHLVNRIYDTGHVEQVYDLYGPSEDTTYSTWTLRARGMPATIGRPIANTRAYVLDPFMKPTPIGVPGQLFLGGDGLARGYLNRPELTAESFVPDPFLQGSHRIYRTGDLVRYRADGQLEYLGRLDHQVKVRGFRIELGEIEAAIAPHPAVRDVAVIVREDTPGEKKLVAYIAAATNADFVAELRDMLRRRLPEYMIPSTFVRLDALPLTPNGKLDRKALPAPDDTGFVREAYAAPQGELEIALASIWSELLRVERIGRNDHFFELGGHSLMAVRLVNRVARLGVELRLATLFASPLFADFARVVSEQKTASQGAFPAITRVPRDGALALSFAQERLWFLSQLEDINDTYRIPIVMHLHGSLDHVAWKRALDALFARHDALRTIFVARDDGEPEVRLLDATLLSYREHDLRRVSAADDVLEQLRDEEARAPFDLARGPLMRVQLIQLADDKHVVLLTQHHIVFDGWSMGVLARELSALYAAFLQDRPDPLPPLAIQYADYAAWQRQWLTGERLRPQVEYWRNTLAGAPALISLPTDRPRPSQQRFEGGGVAVRIDAELTRAIKRLGQQRGTTPFMTVLAAWATVLARLSGQDDIVIGTPSANRGRAEVESLIGCFINTLALRIDLAGDPTTSELLDRVRRTALAAQDHQDLPFEQVVEILQPPRRLDHTPLFQVMFTWQTDEAASFDLPGVRVDSFGIIDNTVKFDLELALGEVGDEIVGAFSYAKSLFDTGTIERHRDYLLKVLRTMATEADVQVHRIDLLSAAERALLLDAWNRADAPYAAHLCTHQLFEQQVARTPDAIAVTCGDGASRVELTYAELNRQADALARHLRALGVTSNQLVGLRTGRNAALIVAILGIHKAGGAYLPLDPVYPTERIAFMLSDANVRIVLTERERIDELAALPVTLICLDEPLPDVPAAPAGVESSGGDLAYVIYTSGSTGQPKGVRITHHNVVRLFTATDHWYGFGPGEVFSLFHSYSFDVSVFEMWGALLYGGRLVVVPQELSRDAEAFRALLLRERVTVLSQTPTAFLQLIDVERASKKADFALRFIIFAGEALELQSLKPWIDRYGDEAPQLINMYGITETTVHVTFRRIVQADLDNHAGSVVGVPIPDLRVYVLDPNGQPSPLGVHGEMYVAGAGVAAGYLNRPELTAARFLPDPFHPIDASGAESRMYRSGDLARRLDNGELEYLGRMDQQVKIRGFRIELGEIEALLAQDASLRQVAVVAREDTPGEKRLVAYLVTDVPQPERVGALRDRLRERLPEYMVPAHFVFLDSLPLTANGKLDRRALPQPERVVEAREIVAPRSASEALVVGVFNEVLNRSDVGVLDDFFELGGHSLMAARLMARLRAAAKVDLPLRNLFERPTPERLAAAIDALAWVASEPAPGRASGSEDREEFEL